MAYSKVPQNSQVGATQIPEQIMAGSYIFAGPVKFNMAQTESVLTVAAAGTSQATAAPIGAYGSVNVTGADATAGVILPKSPAGTSITIYSAAATNVLKVYPHVGGDINDGTPNAAVSITARTPSKFTNIDGTTWAGGFVAAI